MGPGVSTEGFVRGSRKKILVAEDEPAVCEIIIAILEEHYDVVPAVNGTEAMRRIEEDSGFDLLFTDILMPGANGFEVAAHARKLRPTLRILYGTGFVESIGLNPATLHGTLIRKPYRADTLLAIVQEALAA